MNSRQIPELGMGAPNRESPLGDGAMVAAYADAALDDQDRSHPHYHGFFQASLIIGPARLMHDFRETEVSGRTLFFISPGQVHTVRPGPGMSGTIASFTREFFDGGSPEGARLLLEFPLYFAGDAPPWLALPDAHQESAPIQEQFRQLLAEHQAAAPGAGEVIRSLLRILLVKSARIHSQTTGPARIDRSAALAREFQMLVEKHFKEETALEDYARRLGVGVNHLNDVIRESTGRAAGEHIRQRRLLSAKRHLLHSELSVSEIGYRLGFKDPSYFGRFFRRYEGVTPADFRVQSREKYRASAG